MIKSIDEILEKLGLGYSDKDYTILKNWANNIINECNKTVSELVHAEYTGLDKIKERL